MPVQNRILSQNSGHLLEHLPPEYLAFSTPGAAVDHR
jgi:hypothetical protein